MPAKTAVDVRDFQDRPSFTSGIQEAIDALPRGGGSVRIPAGTWRLRRRVTLRSGVSLLGDGPGTVLVRPRQVLWPLAQSVKPGAARLKLTGTAGFEVGDEIYLRDEFHYSYWSAHGFVVELERRGLRWKQVATRFRKPYTRGPHALAANWFPALWVPHCADVSISNLTIAGRERKRLRKWGDFTCSAVHCYNATHVRIENVTVRDWPGDGISLQKGDGIVRGCVVERCHGHGLHPGTSVGRSIWANNVATGCSRDGFFFCLGVHNAVVSGNILQGNAGHGIGGLTYPDRGNTVTANQCLNNGLHGIDAAHAVGNTIVGNICRSNSRKQRGAYAGIFLSHHADNVVKDNVCFDDAKRPTQLQGVVSAEPLGENVIADNIESAYGAAAYEACRPTRKVRKAY